MARLMLPAFCLAAVLAAPARGGRETGWDSHREYIFQPNVLYTITYAIDQNETRVLESAYFKQIWLSPATDLEHAFVDPATTIPQERFTRFFLAEFWKEYPDGRQESYLIPVRSIVEVRYLVKQPSGKQAAD